MTGRVSIQAPTRRATILVAAADSSARAKRAADFVCVGADDQEQIQAAIALLGQSGGTIGISDGNYSFANHVHVTADNVTLQFSRNAMVTAIAGGFSAVDYDSGWSRTKQFIYLDGCTGSGVTGGNFDGSAFDTHVTGESAAAIFGRAVTDCTIDRVNVHDFNPTVTGQNIYGGWPEDGRNIRYRGVFFWASINVTISRSVGRNVKYNVFGFHGTTTGSRMTGCWSEMCYENHQVGGNTSFCLISNNHAGLYTAHGLVTHGEHIVFAGNTLGPPYDTPDGLDSLASAIAANSSSSNVVIVGNSMRLTGLACGIRLSSSSYPVVASNSIVEPTEGIVITASVFGAAITGNALRSVMSIGISQRAGSTMTLSTIVGNSIVISSAAGVAERVGISILLDRATCVGNNVHCANDAAGGVVLNAIAGTTIGTFVGNRIWTNGKVVGWNRNVVTSGNIGFPVSNSGSAAVASDNTSVVVTHGLAATPEIRDIQITPTNSLGNAAKFWISTPTSTQFTIHVDADPGPDTATFAWSAEIKP